VRNPVTWFEIIGKDAAALHKFYGEVFGWELTPPVAAMGNYSMLQDYKPNDHGAGGGIGGSQDDASRVSVYIEVDDPQRYMDRATKAGATMIMPVTQITPDTTIGMFRDPAGNVNGILKANALASTDPRAAAQAAQKRTGRKTTRAKPTTKRGAKKTTRRATTARKSTRSTGRRKRR
jgi:predicted enzyme related to lactoylglutathione lyase